MGRATDVEDNAVSKVIPPNHFATARYFKIKFSDAMAIFNSSEAPSIFPTFTANPGAPEVYHLLEGLEGDEKLKNQDLVSRVFEDQVHDLMKNLPKIFGRKIPLLSISLSSRNAVYLIYIAFSASTLQMVTSMSVLLMNGYRLSSHGKRDIFFNFNRLMIHNHCPACWGPAGKSKRHFPMDPADDTSVTPTERYIYKRGDNDRYVAPYNEKTLLRYQSQLNLDVVSPKGAVSSKKFKNLVFKEITRHIKGENNVFRFLEGRMSLIKAHHEATNFSVPYL